MSRSGLRRGGLALVAVALLAACTGTVTPTLPTLLVVARDGAPASLAVVAVDLSPTGRALRLVSPTAHAFEPGTALLDLDALPRTGVPSEAWLLVAAADGASGLERFDLRDVADDPATTVPRLGDRVALTTAARGWAPDLTPGAYLAPVCPRRAVVGGPSSAPSRYVALWDRCPEDAEGDGRVHVVDLVDRAVTTWSGTVFDDVGVFPGVADAATFTTVRVELGEARTAETRRFDTAAAVVASAALADGDEALLDVAVAGGTTWALLRPDGGDVVVRGVAGDGTEVVRPALANATRLHASPAPAVLTLTTGQVQAVFADTASPATALAVAGAGAAPAAVGATVEANDYAVLATTGGSLCALDARVPATSAGCEFTLPALAGARFLTWTYAASSPP